MEAQRGIEPLHRGFADRSVSTSPLRRVLSLQFLSGCGLQRFHFAIVPHLSILSKNVGFNELVKYNGRVWARSSAG